MITLPACTEVVLQMQSEYRNWETIGNMKNGHDQAYAFKTKTGDQSVTLYYVFTPNLALAEGVMREKPPSALCCSYQSYWQIMRDLTCKDGDATVYVVTKSYQVKDKI